mgnify:FL=1
MPVDKNHNYDSFIKDYERRLKHKDKRKRARMKVSGDGVKKLRNIISNSNYRNAKRKLQNAK